MTSTSTIKAEMQKAFKVAGFHDHENHAINCVKFALYLLECEPNNANFEIWVKYYFSRWEEHYNENCPLEYKRMGDAALDYYSTIASVLNVQQKDWLSVHFAQNKYYNAVYVLFSEMKILSSVREVFSTSGNEDLNVFCKLAWKYCRNNQF